MSASHTRGKSYGTTEAKITCHVLQRTQPEINVLQQSGKFLRNQLLTLRVQEKH